MVLYWALALNYNLCLRITEQIYSHRGVSMDSNQTAGTSRRDFLKITTAGLTVLGGAVLLTCVGGCSDNSIGPVALTGKKVQITLADNPELATVGGSVRKTFTEGNDGKPVIVVRTASNKFQTMSTTCTHEGETIGTPNGNKVICPRHGAQFSTAEGNFGANIGGQSTTALQTFVTTFDAANGIIEISL